MTFFELIPYIFTGIGLIISVYAAIKKTNPEIRYTEANTGKTTAETVRIYAQEVKDLKEELLKTDERIEEMELQIKNLIKEHEKEKDTYKKFIVELLYGINKLTGQLKEKDISPLWVPPVMPLD